MKLGLVVNALEAQRQMQGLLKNSGSAVAAGTKEVTQAALTVLKSQAAAAFSGGKMQNTWHSTYHANKGFDAVGYITTRPLY